MGRGIAVLIVILFHVGTYSVEHFNYQFLGNIFLFGYGGVDIFFVLSGFVIFYSHWRDIGQRDRPPTYVLRRFSRIFPLYWLLTLAKLAAIFTLPGLAKQSKTTWPIIVASFTLWPLPVPEIYPIIGIAWSLSNEMLFYLLFALGFWLNRQTLAKVIIGWGIVSLGFTWLLPLFGFHPQAAPHLVRFVLDERNLEFILGVGAGYVFVASATRLTSFRRQAWLANCIGLVGLAGVCAFISITRVVTLPYSLAFGLPVFLILLGSAYLEAHPLPGPPQPLSQLIGQALVFLGNASYSLYLAHFLIFDAVYYGARFLRLTDWLPPGMIAISLLVAALVGGSLVYYLVERPLLRLTHAWIKGPLALTRPPRVNAG